MGKLKIKGAYWYPDPLNYAESISECQPPAWHRDFNPTIVTRAAVAAMVHNIPPETFIRAHTDPFDFCLRAKVDRSSKLMLGDEQIQSTTRYYVVRSGKPLVKISPPPPGHQIGQWRRKNGVTLQEYNRVMAETGGEWDERVCSGKLTAKVDTRTKYDNRRMAFEAGWQICECNDIADFDFSNVNYDYYIAEAKKLIIA